MRYDGLAQVREDFGYDALNRLTQWEVQTPCDRTATAFSYDDLGNLMARTATSGMAAATTTQRLDYRYGEGTAGPHALTGLGGERFGYDAKGNQTSWDAGDGRFRQVTYTGFDLPLRLEGPNGLRLDFAYDGHQRRVLKQSAGGGRTVYVAGLYEQRRTAAVGEHLFHVRAHGRPVAQVAWSESGGGVVESTAYLHEDSLGSVETVTDVAGQVLERRKYQPYGQPAHPRNPAQAVTPGAGRVRQGFTGHEEDPEVELINMGGRMYEPRVGRFLTADPYVQAPFFGPAHNRYAYAFNNPLNWVDPTGFSAVGVCATAEGGPCEGGAPSENSWSGVAEGLGQAWEAVRGAAGQLAQWHEQQTRRAVAGTAPPEPLPGGAAPTPTADVHGGGQVGGQVAMGAGLALSEVGLGMVADSVRTVVQGHGQAALEQGLALAGTLLEGAAAGYAEDGLSGAVMGGLNTVNPVYQLLTTQCAAQESVQAMKYMRVRWIHGLPGEPHLIYIEVDQDGWEVRKVEIFRDGRWGFASSTESSDKTRLGEVAMPPLAEIAADP